MGDPVRAVKVNLENFKRKPIYAICILALISFLVCVIVAVTAAPNIFGGSTLDYNLCKSSEYTFCFNYFRTENYAYFNVKLSPQNQIFYLQLDFYSKTEIDEEIKYDLFIKDSADFRSLIYRELNKTMSIKCSKGVCDSELLFYLTEIKDYDYIVDLRFYGVIPVDSMKFKIRYIAKEFTQFFLIIKYIFLALSILALANFSYHLYIVKWKVWSMESKLSGFMLLSLFIFNEPMLYLTLSKMTYNWVALSIFCNFQFVGLLIIFWFQVLKKDLSFVVIKSALTIVESLTVCAFLILMSIVYGLTIKEQKINPTFSWEYDLPVLGKRLYIAGFSLLIILALMMLTYIAFSIKPLVKSLRVGDRSAKRRNSMQIFVYFMIITTFLFIGIGAFQPAPRSGTLLLVSVSFFNISLILLSWLYTPSIKAYKEFLSQRMKEENNHIVSPDDSNQDGNNDGSQPAKIIATDFQGITVALNKS